MTQATRQAVQILVLCIVVFVATVAICLGVQNGVFSGPSLAEQIQNDGFGQIVKDRQQQGQQP
jgi:hypothetical protein